MNYIALLVLVCKRAAHLRTVRYDLATVLEGKEKHQADQCEGCILERLSEAIDGLSDQVENVLSCLDSCSDGRIHADLALLAVILQRPDSLVRLTLVDEIVVAALRDLGHL